MLSPPRTLQWAADAIGVACPAGEAGTRFCRVTTDSRAECAGALFIAIPGDKFDGHDYVQTAFDNGAAAAVVTKPLSNSGPLLVVPDAVGALGKIGSAHRAEMPARIAAVTGSVGKTSTKELLGTIVRSQDHAVISAKNHNNEIGVPRTLLQLNIWHAFAVIEMGMRGAGQIGYLADIARPDIGIVTNIGVSHLEMLGSREAIADAKGELLERLGPGGTAIIPAPEAQGSQDLELLVRLRSHVPRGVRILTFAGGPEIHADVMVLQSDWSADGSRLLAFQTPEGPGSARIAAAGSHHAINAAAAVAAAIALGITPAAACAALDGWAGAAGRMEVIQFGTLRLLNDCYNAGPESMRAALSTLCEFAPEGGVAFLGDMRELGSVAPQAHAELGREAGAARLRLLVAVGEFSQSIASAATAEAVRIGAPPPDVHTFANAAEAAEAAPDLLHSSDTILIKGSRAVAMEQITARIQVAAGADHG